MDKPLLLSFLFLLVLIFDCCVCHSIRHQHHHREHRKRLSDTSPNNEDPTTANDGDVSPKLTAVEESDDDGDLSSSEKSSDAASSPVESTSESDVKVSLHDSPDDYSRENESKRNKNGIHPTAPTTTTTTMHPDDGAIELEDDGDFGDDDRSNIGGKPPKKDRLLLILIDGLRHNMIDRRHKGFRYIYENGVRAMKVKPVFPSLSTPNYYSIVTGLYPNKHQIIANDMYSVQYDEYFHGKNFSHPHWWNRAEPVWIRAARKGRRVRDYRWDGARIELFGTRIQVPPGDYYRVKDSNEKAYDKMFSDRLSSMVQDFRDNKLDFGLLTYGAVDMAGHKFGPESKEVKKAIRRIDKILSQLIEEAKDLLNESLTLYIVSDHGMGPVHKHIIIDDHVDFNDVKLMVGYGAFAMLLPEEGKDEFILRQLLQSSVEGLNFYASGRLPTHFRLERAEHLLPIVLTADPGYMIVKSPIQPDNNLLGLHGWDGEFDDNMSAMMVAMGPHFKKNFTLREMSMVDHYNLLCHIMGIRPRDNDGDWLLVEKALEPPEDEEDYENDDDFYYEGYSSSADKILLNIFIFWTCLASLFQNL